MTSAEREAANRQHLQRLCQDSNYAYETGYNVGLDRGRFDTSWMTSSCAPETRERVRTAYQDGYRQGIANAPIVVRGSVTATTPSWAARCTFSSDCGDDQSCRRDAHGDNVCMGGGYRGEACWFSSDCLSESCELSTKTCR